MLCTQPYSYAQLGTDVPEIFQFILSVVQAIFSSLNATQCRQTWICFGAIAIAPIRTYSLTTNNCSCCFFINWKLKYLRSQEDEAIFLFHLNEKHILISHSLIKTCRLHSPVFVHPVDSLLPMESTAFHYCDSYCCWKFWILNTW